MSHFMRPYVQAQAGFWQCYVGLCLALATLAQALCLVFATWAGQSAWPYVLGMAITGCAAIGFTVFGLGALYPADIPKKTRS